MAGYGHVKLLALVLKIPDAEAGEGLNAQDADGRHDDGQEHDGPQLQRRGQRSAGEMLALHHSLFFSDAWGEKRLANVGEQFAMFQTMRSARGVIWNIANCSLTFTNTNDSDSISVSEHVSKVVAKNVMSYFIDRDRAHVTKNNTKTMGSTLGNNPWKAMQLALYWKH